MADDFWGQFQPENASGNSPLNGGSGFYGSREAQISGMPPSGGYNGGPMGQILPADPNQQVRGPDMPQTRPNPAFEAFYAQQQAAGVPFAQIMDQWQAQQGPKPGNSLLPGDNVQPHQGGGGGVSMADFSRAWEQSPYPGTVDGLKQFLASNPAYAASGITLGGSKGDKVYGPGGAFWGDAVIAAGEGGRGKSALTGDAGGAGGGMAFGSMLTPYGEKYNLPTQAELEAMPGYQAAQAAAMEATQRGAASKGTLLTGGTQRALQQNAGTVASQMYGQLAGLGLGAQSFNRDTFYHNQDAPFSKLLGASQLGYNAASQPTVPAGTSTSYTPPVAAPVSTVPAKKPITGKGGIRP